LQFLGVKTIENITLL